MRRRAAIALCTLALGACFQHHVTLAPPPPSITPDERVALFHAMKPARSAQLKESTDGGDTWEVVNRTITLENKVEVVSPEDLAPLVASDSETMRAARRSTSARFKSNVAYTVSLLSVAAGAAVLFGVTGDRIDPFVGVGVTLASALVFGWIARHYSRIELDERKRAFSAYTRDLGARLNVCAHGLQVIACETAPP